MYTASISQGLPYHFNLHQTDTDIPSFSPHTLTNDILCDRNGYLYQLHTEQASLFTLLSDTCYTNACPLTDTNILVSPASKEYLEELDFNGTMQNRYQIKGECIAMATNAKDTGILLKQEDSLYFITLSELSRIENTPDSLSLIHI